MSAPRFSPATLAALARYADARQKCIESRQRGWLPSAKEFDLARFALEAALDADRERAMLAAEDASLVGAMVRVALANHAEDGARDCQPHRFNDVRRTMEAL